MDHLQYEAMLFEAKDLDPKARAALAAHMAECRACSELAPAFESMVSRLRQASFVQPTAGFVARFQDRLARKQRKAHERTLTLAVITIITGVMVCAILFGGELLSWLSPLTSAGLKYLAQAFRIGNLLGMLGSFLTLLVEGVVGNLSPAYALAASAAFSGLLLVWVMSLYRINYLSIRRE